MDPSSFRASSRRVASCCSHCCRAERFELILLSNESRVSRNSATTRPTAMSAMSRNFASLSTAFWTSSICPRRSSMASTRSSISLAIMSREALRAFSGIRSTCAAKESTDRCSASTFRCACSWVDIRDSMSEARLDFRVSTSARISSCPPRSSSAISFIASRCPSEPCTPPTLSSTDSSNCSRARRSAPTEAFSVSRAAKMSFSCRILAWLRSTPASSIRLTIACSLESPVSRASASSTTNLWSLDISSSWLLTSSSSLRCVCCSTLASVCMTWSRYLAWSSTFLCTISMLVAISASPSARNCCSSCTDSTNTVSCWATRSAASVLALVSSSRPTRICSHRLVTLSWVAAASRCCCTIQDLISAKVALVSMVAWLHSARAFSVFNDNSDPIERNWDTVSARATWSDIRASCTRVTWSSSRRSASSRILVEAVTLWSMSSICWRVSLSLVSLSLRSAVTALVASPTCRRRSAAMVSRSCLSWASDERMLWTSCTTPL
mmetsp:Transcript_41735/g.109930  ORF Transcript_41735/g.109930 Transcript_41735/m.109930 type:complete len:496 (+) Transcript_41735:641-2128(+)